jgi:hypothetical protein
VRLDLDDAKPQVRGETSGVSHFALRIGVGVGKDRETAGAEDHMSRYGEESRVDSTAVRNENALEFGEAIEK